MNPTFEIANLPDAVKRDPAAMRLCSEAIQMRAAFARRVDDFVARFGRVPRLPASYFEQRAAHLHAGATF